MATLRALALLASAVLLAPAALASGDLAADSVTLSGATSLSGGAAALFFILQDAGGVEWEITAQSGTLEITYLEEVALDNPLNAETYLYSAETDSGQETLPLGAATLVSRGGQVGGALLARTEAALDGGAGAFGASSDLVHVKSVSDPTVAQYGESDVRAGEAAGIEETLPGELLRLEVQDGVLTLTGDLVLDVFGPWYDLSTADGAASYRTGEVETFRAGAGATVRVERHHLVLRDAVLTATIAQEALLFTDAAEGKVLGTLAGDGDLLYSGETPFALAPSDGLVSTTSPALLAAAGAPVVQPRLPVGLLAVGIAAALVLVAGGVLLARRRDRGDDLELALLAMNERRWDDALPRLARVAKRDPTNAAVQVDRALCLEQVGRFDEAARAFESALRAAPKNAEAHFYYARTLAKMQQRDAARVHLETALERDPRLVEMMRAESVLRGL